MDKRILKGGQGRSDADMMNSALVVCVCFVGAILAVLLAVGAKVG